MYFPSLEGACPSSHWSEAALASVQTSLLGFPHWEFSTLAAHTGPLETTFLSKSLN